MEREEFRKIFDEAYWHWCSKWHANEASWWYSVEEFAVMSYGRARRAEKEAAKEVK